MREFGAQAPGAKDLWCDVAHYDPLQGERRLNQQDQSAHL
jgi:hypothetical protein